MAGGGSLKFVVEIAANDANKTLDAITTAVNQAGVKMRTSMLGVGSGATEAGRASEGLEGKLKALKTEMVQGDRTVNFFATKLTGSLVPATSAAGEGIRLVTDGVIGLLSGLGKFAAIGIAIEAVSLGIKLWKDHINEANEKAKKFAEDGLKAAEEAGQRAAKAIGNVWGGGDSANAAKAQIAEMKRAEAIANARIAAMEEGKDREEAEKKLQELVRQRTELELALPGKIAKEQREQEEKRRDEQRKSEHEIAELRNAALIGEAKIRAEVEERVKNLRATHQGSTIQQLKDLEVAVRKDGERQIVEYRKARTQEFLEWFVKARSAAEKAGESTPIPGQEKNGTVGFKPPRESWVGGTPPGEEQGPTNFPRVKFKGDLGGKAPDEEGMKVRTDLIKAQADEAKRKTAELRAEIESASSAAASFGEAFGAAMARGATPLQALGAALKQAMQQMLQFAIKAITARAADAAAGAASSQAEIPIVGPALAAGAMAGMLAMVMGLIGNLPSAAGGMKVPSDTLAFIHKDEHVLPARIARNYERGGTGMVVNNNYGPIMDGRDVMRTLKRNDAAVRAANRRLARTRRA